MKNTWRPKQLVRPIAVAIIKRNLQLLLSAVRNDQGDVKGWRPLGGGIEFGETAEVALLRELQEETGENITVGRLLGVLENIYQHEGVTGHEIVFVYEANFRSQGAYDKPQYEFEDGGNSNVATWVDIKTFAHRKAELYPEALRKILVSSFSP